MSSSSSSGSYNFKIVLLGEGAVGKTSIVLRYVEDKFNERHISTLQASFLNKKLNIDGKRVNLAIWDTAGQEKFHALGPIYYRMSNGAVLVYDITDEDSFQKVKNWVKELKKMLGNEICIVIVGNKADLEKHRTVSLQQAEEYAAQVSAKHFIISAKLNRGIEEVFLDLTRSMLLRAEEQQRARESAQNRSASLKRNVLIVNDDDADELTGWRRRKCCAGPSN